jgi:hypothetical protein
MSERRIYPFVLNTRRDILLSDILIVSAGISSPSTATMIILVMITGQKEHILSGFKDTYYAAATRPAGRYNGK